MTTPKLSLLATADDLIRSQNILSDGLAEREFLKFAQYQENCRIQWLAAVKESRRLQTELENAHSVISKLEVKLHHAKGLVDTERRQKIAAIRERDTMESQIISARNLLFSECQTPMLNNETLGKMHAFLNATFRTKQGPNNANRLDTISEGEMNNTGTLLSDLSYSRSEDDLDVSRRKFRKYRASNVDEEVITKKRRSSGRHDAANKSSTKVMEINPNDRVVATTTVSVPSDGNGPIVARSIIEAIPEEPIQQTPHHYKKSPLKQYSENLTPSAPKFDFDSWTRDASPTVSRTLMRSHNFMHKTMIRSEPCGACNARIRFGKVVLKCRDCKAISHNECKDSLPVPCVPLGNTPTLKGCMGSISDYTPITDPMIPGIVVHCVNEVESRGLSEVGIYRIPGSEKEVKALKERFLSRKGVPGLSTIDIHVICGCLKDFLRSLKEPLITISLWEDFVAASEDRTDRSHIDMNRAIMELPQPNRDTLAYLVLHLQRVASCPEVLMPIGNLSKIFGPTVVGYSSLEPEPCNLLKETRQQVAVMEQLLLIPTEYWSAFVHTNNVASSGPSEQMLRTPSSDSVGMQNRYLQTPSKSGKFGKSKKQFL